MCVHPKSRLGKWATFRVTAVTGHVFNRDFTREHGVAAIVGGNARDFAPAQIKPVNMERCHSRERLLRDQKPLARGV